VCANEFTPNEFSFTQKGKNFFMGTTGFWKEDFVGKNNEKDFDHVHSFEKFIKFVESQNKVDMLLSIFQNMEQARGLQMSNVEEATPDEIEKFLIEKLFDDLKYDSDAKRRDFAQKVVQGSGGEDDFSLEELQQIHRALQIQKLFDDLEYELGAREVFTQKIVQKSWGKDKISPEELQQIHQYMQATKIYQDRLKNLNKVMEAYWYNSCSRQPKYIRTV